MDNKAVKRQQLYDLLGILPERDYKIGYETISVEEKEKYILEKLVLDLNGIEKVPTYVAKPKNFKGKAPAVLYNHFHGSSKEELIEGDRELLQSPPYAEVLTSMGYIAFCIDTWFFGERRGKSEEDLFKEFIWHGRVLWGMMVYDSIRALDYLCSRGDVDPGRIATMGISMGSTMAWWLSALDERIKVCIDICCMTEFEELIRTCAVDQHGIYYYVPGLLRYFSTSSINELICPRYHLSLNGLYDKLTPADGLVKVDEYLKDTYARAGVPDRWKMEVLGCGHMETAWMRHRILGYLRDTL